MIKKQSIVSVALLAVLAGTASAEPVAPDAVMFQDMTVPESLTGQPGDPANGRKVFANTKLGNCLACHANSDQSDQLFHGDVGPSLDEFAGGSAVSQCREGLEAHGCQLGRMG